MSDCIFCHIVARKIPSQPVYEDEYVYAFLDIHPINPGHVLVVPKQHSVGLHDADEAVLQQLILATQKIARAVVTALNTTGFNLVENNGVIAGQVIPHVHFHIIPRRPEDGLKPWPGTSYAEGEATRVAESIRKNMSLPIRR